MSATEKTSYSNVSAIRKNGKVFVPFEEVEQLVNATVEKVVERLVLDYQYRSPQSEHWYRSDEFMRIYKCTLSGLMAKVKRGDVKKKKIGGESYYKPLIIEG
jgi:hypothetical protein